MRCFFVAKVRGLSSVHQSSRSRTLLISKSFFRNHGPPGWALSADVQFNGDVKKPPKATEKPNLRKDARFERMNKCDQRFTCVHHHCKTLEPFRCPYSSVFLLVYLSPWISVERPLSHLANVLQQHPLPEPHAVLQGL